ncbi:MAG TPA: mannosyltransferase family protein [Kiritimatiellia bacterium]|nr:mannosyltransferase family protein [Kiritimatiellia bacterium]HMP34367.1 mannosyltransferase family protein [Kiritimatiellia bacterium]
MSSTATTNPAPADRSGRLPWLTLGAYFLLSRLTILVAGYYSNLRIDKFKWYQKQGHFTDPFFQWDSYWYLGIIQSGYHYEPGTPSNVHFFPLFPLLVRLFGGITGEYVVTGFVLANLFLFAAVCLLYKLVIQDGGSHALADRAALYLCVFPTGFFLSLFYPESLYLMLSLATLLLARQQRWGWACACGGLLALAKTPGVLIFAPVAMEYLGVERNRLWPWRWNRPRSSILWLALIPAGLALYMLYLHHQFGDAFAFSKATASWNRKVVPFYETFAHARQYPPFEQILYHGSVLLALASLITGLFIRVRLSYLVYGGMLLFLFVSSNVLESIQRHVLMIFPVYLVLGMIGVRNRLADTGWLMFSLMLLTLFTVVFTAGYRMY